MADTILQVKLGVGLAQFLHEQRSRGLSLEGINHELIRQSDGSISVTASTIRRWIDTLGIGEQLSLDDVGRS